MVPASLVNVDLAADVADLRVGERLASSCAQRVRRPQRVGVAERDHVAARGPHRGVLGADLAAARQLEHDVGAGRAGARRGLVARAVDGDDHLEPLARPVERERVGDLRRDHRLLVVGGDRRASRRASTSPVGRDRRRALQAAQQRQRGRVERLRPDDQGGGDPEQRAQRRRGWWQVRDTPRVVLTDGVITLRPPEPGDVDAIYEACQDPEIQRWTGVPVAVPARARDRATSSASPPSARPASRSRSSPSTTRATLLGNFSVMELDQRRRATARSATGWPRRRAARASPRAR